VAKKKLMNQAMMKMLMTITAILNLPEVNIRQ